MFNKTAFVDIKKFKHTYHQNKGINGGDSGVALGVYTLGASTHLAVN